MLESDQGIKISHSKPAPSSNAPDTPASTSETPQTGPIDSNAQTSEEYPPRPIFAELLAKTARLVDQTPETPKAPETPTAPQPTEPTPINPAPAPESPQNIQTIQTSDPNFVVTKNLDAASVFATATPSANFEPIKPTEPIPTPEEQAPRPVFEMSNPMAPRQLFEDTAPKTPSVAFNDPANAPDAPKPGTDPGAENPLSAESLKRIKEKINSPKVQETVKSAKSNPMKTLLIISSLVIILLIVAIAIVS